MKKALQLIMILGLTCLGAGCTSTRGYFVDRCRDATDMVTLCVEEKGLNVSAQVLTLSTGLGVAKGKGLGLRSGALGKYEFVEHQVVLAGEKILIPSARDTKRGKAYDITCELIPLVGAVHFDNQGGWHNDLRIEVAACLGAGIRVGCNVGEILDFILGWTTIDICKDDLERKKRESNKSIQATPEGAPDRRRWLKRRKERHEDIDHVQP